VSLSINILALINKKGQKIYHRVVLAHDEMKQDV